MIILKNSIEEITHYIMNRLENALKNHEGPFHLGLSGGRTPKAIFEQINHYYRDFPYWKQVHFWWGDERLVPLGSDESNAGIACRTLLDHLDINKKTIHIIKGDLSKEEALKDLQKQMKILPMDKDNLPYLHWNILGLGEDGHTASLFPDFQDWDCKENVLMVQNPYNLQWRISLSPAMIARSQRTTFLVTGDSKAEVLSNILQNHKKAENYPAYKIQTQLKKVEWLCDLKALSMTPSELYQD